MGVEYILEPNFTSHNLDKVVHRMFIFKDVEEIELISFIARGIFSEIEPTRDNEKVKFYSQYP